MLPLRPLTRPQEDDGGVCRRYRTQRTASLCVAIHLGDDDGSDLDAVLEGLGLVKCGLPDAAVHDEDHQVGLHSSSNLSSNRGGWGQRGSALE